jgi:hypothetical protein
MEYLLDKKNLHERVEEEIVIEQDDDSVISTQEMLEQELKNLDTNNPPQLNKDSSSLTDQKNMTRGLRKKKQTIPFEINLETITIKGKSKKKKLSKIH